MTHADVLICNHVRQLSWLLAKTETNVTQVWYTLRVVPDPSMLIGHTLLYEYRLYNEQWHSTQLGLRDLLEWELPKQPPKPEKVRIPYGPRFASSQLLNIAYEQNKQAAFQKLATMYVKYVIIFRKLEECYDQVRTCTHTCTHTYTYDTHTHAHTTNTYICTHMTHIHMHTHDTYTCTHNTHTAHMHTQHTYCTHAHTHTRHTHAHT